MEIAFCLSLPNAYYIILNGSWQLRQSRYP
nr:MAG TPA: hypothetical protein [Caudoviricetes sp.]